MEGDGPSSNGTFLSDKHAPVQSIFPLKWHPFETNQNQGINLQTVISIKMHSAIKMAYRFSNLPW